jgi:lipopolysaccharide export system permease protein
LLAVLRRDAGAALQSMAKQQKLLAKFSTITFAAAPAVGARRQPADQRAQAVGGGEFGGMLIFELTPGHELKSAATASSAAVQPDGTWKLTRYAATQFGGATIEATKEASRAFNSTIGGDFLALTVREPRQLESRVLWGLMRYLKENDLDSGPQEFAFWSRIARTTAILFAALLAVPFVFGSLRAAGAGSRTLIGVLIGVSFFFAQRMLESGAVVFDASPFVLAWLPTFVLAGISRVDRANPLARAFSSAAISPAWFSARAGPSSRADPPAA